MKDAAFAAYMDRTWVNWRRQLNGVMCERMRLAFLAGAEVERKEMETGKCHEKSKSAPADTPPAKIGTYHPKPPSKASSSRKNRRHK